MVSRTRGEKVFNVFNLTVLGLVGLMALYPFVYTISMSLSSAAEAMRASLHLYPRDVSLTSYRMVLSNPEIVTGFTNSILRTVLGTALTLFFTCLTAYPLARREMPHRGPLLFLVLFTMLFSGGIVPNYSAGQKPRSDRLNMGAGAATDADGLQHYRGQEFLSSHPRKLGRVGQDRRGQRV